MKPEMRQMKQVPTIECMLLVKSGTHNDWPSVTWIWSSRIKKIIIKKSRGMKTSSCTCTELYHAFWSKYSIMHYTSSKCEHKFRNYDRREKTNRALIKDLVVPKNMRAFFSAFFFSVTVLLTRAAPVPLPTKKLKNHHSPLQNPRSFDFMTSR